MLRLIYVCGLRVPEAVAVVWGDLVTVDGLNCLKVTGKGGKTAHVEVMDDDLWSELMRLRGNASELLFRSQWAGRKGMLDRLAARMIFIRAAKKHDLPASASIHDLRHMTASHLFVGAALDDAVKISKHMRHCRVSTTTDFYCHAPQSLGSIKHRLAA